MSKLVEPHEGPRSFLAQSGKAQPAGGRAALYLRVSTKDQTPENQELALRAWAERLGLDVVVAPYTDTVSGARGDRAALAAVLAGAHRREFDVLLIWSLDRLSREGIGAMARYMEQFRAAGVRVMSHQEPWLDTGGPVGDLLVAIFAWVGQQERQRIGERIRAGLVRAKAQGVQLGRRPRPVDLKEVARRRAAGQSWGRIAKALKVPSRTLRRRATTTRRRQGRTFRAGRGPVSGTGTNPPVNCVPHRLAGRGFSRGQRGGAQFETFGPQGRL